MKLVFFLFLFIYLCRENDALRCVNYGGQVTFTADWLDEAKQFVDNLNTTGEKKVCVARYLVTYPEKIFTVLFGEDFSNLAFHANTDVYFDIVLTMAANGSAIDPGLGRKQFIFKCDDGDACERRFWRHHINFFVEENSTIFETAFRSVLINGIQQQGKTDGFFKLQIQKFSDNSSVLECPCSHRLNIYFNIQ